MKHFELLKKSVLVANYGKSNQRMCEFSNNEKLTYKNFKNFIEFFSDKNPLTKLYIYNLYINHKSGSIHILIELLRKSSTLEELRLSKNHLNILNTRLILIVFIHYL